MPDYNYDEFSAEGYDFDHSTGPQMGEKAPDVRVSDLDGDSIRLLDFDGEFLVIEMGSLTCPLFQTRRAKMQILETHGTQITSVILYTREAHPGADIPRHRNIEDKRSCAKRLKREDGETREILVDDLVGTAHQAFGCMPNTLFIINKAGCVVFRAEWNNPTATQSALDALIQGGPLHRRSYFRPGTPNISLHTLRRAGKGSGFDFLRSFPSLVWNNLIKRNLRILLNRPHPLARDTTC